jgi:hypothetical protein
MDGAATTKQAVITKRKGYLINGTQHKRQADEEYIDERRLSFEEREAIRKTDDDERRVLQLEEQARKETISELGSDHWDEADVDEMEPEPTSDYPAQGQPPSMEQQIAEIMSRLRESEAQNAALTQRLQAQTNQAAPRQEAAQQQAGPHTAPARLAQRSTTDQTFKGKTEDYRSWRNLIRMNAMADEGCWRNEFSKIVWVRGLLEGDAALMAGGWFDTYTDRVMNDGRLLGSGWDEMWTVLNKFFFNHFDQNRRLVEYRRVQQGNRSHTEYYQEWESKRNAAGVEAPVNSMLADYMSGLNPKLRDHVQGFVDSEERTWEGYVALISRMAEGWEANHTYGNDNSRGRNWQPRVSTHGAPRTTTQGGEAMDIDKAPLWAGRKAKWVGETELENRRRNWQCLRCGSSDHKIRNCPLEPAVRPGNARIAAARTTTVPAGAWVEEEKDQP